MLKYLADPSTRALGKTGKVIITSRVRVVAAHAFVTGANVVGDLSGREGTAANVEISAVEVFVCGESILVNHERPVHVQKQNSISIQELHVETPSLAASHDHNPNMIQPMLLESWAYHGVLLGTLRPQQYRGEE